MTRFGDITYCASDCANRACVRNYGPYKAAAAESMLGKNPSIDVADCRTGCGDYQAPALRPEERALRARHEGAAEGAA